MEPQSPPPISKGRLLTKESHAKEMRMAEDRVTNFYAQVIPSPSSPDYQVKIKDFQGRVIVRNKSPSRQFHQRGHSSHSHESMGNQSVNTAAELNQALQGRPVSPLAPGTPKSMPQNTSDGIGDFWINVTSSGTLPPVLGENHVRFYNEQQRMQSTNPLEAKDDDSLGEDELLIIKGQPSLAQDKQTPVRKLVVKGQSTSTSAFHLVSDPMAAAATTTAEDWSLKAYASSQETDRSAGNAGAVKPQKKKDKTKDEATASAGLTVQATGLHNPASIPQTSHPSNRSGLPASGMGASSSLPHLSPHLTNSLQTSSQIIRDIAGDRHYDIHAVETASNASESQVSTRVPPHPTDSTLKPGLLLVLDDGGAHGDVKGKGEMVVQASAVPIRMNAGPSTVIGGGRTSVTQGMDAPSVAFAAGGDVMTDSLPTTLPSQVTPVERSFEHLGSPFVPMPSAQIDILHNSSYNRDAHPPVQFEGSYFEDEEDDDEWEREAELELRRAFSMSALPPTQAANTLKRALVDLNLDLSKSQAVGSSKAGHKMTKLRQTRPAVLPPLMSGPSVSASGPPSSTALGSPGRPLALGTITGSNALAYLRSSSSKETSRASALKKKKNPMLKPLVK